jgi:hypothetical protein
MKLPAISEREVLRNAMAFLRFLGWKVERRNVGMLKVVGPDGRCRRVRFGKPGEADLYGRLPGRRRRRFELEIKRAGKRPTARQQAFLQTNNDAGCVCFWVDNMNTLERIAPLIAAGYRVVYGHGCDYDLVAPRSRKS